MSNTKQSVRFFLFEAFHGKRDVGSSRIRGHNLVKYWDEAALYRYGEKADVMIYQKVYMTYDYAYQNHFNGIQILDICDPDWRDSPDIYIKQTMDVMDGVVVPTETMREYLQAMTETPVRIIKDRFDLAELPEPKKHLKEAKRVVWFGYAHNAESLKFAVPSLEKRGLELLIVSNEDPAAYRWASDPEAYKLKYKYKKYVHPEAYTEIQKGDIVILPAGLRPLDMFKSENKTIIAHLLGLPVATTTDELDKLLTAESRNEYINAIYDKLKQEYDVKKSVAEYKDFINELSRNT